MEATITRAAQARINRLCRSELIEELLSIDLDASAPEYKEFTDDELRDMVSNYLADHYQRPFLAFVE